MSNWKWWVFYEMSRTWAIENDMSNLFKRFVIHKDMHNLQGHE